MPALKTAALATALVVCLIPIYAGAAEMSKVPVLTNAEALMASSGLDSLTQPHTIIERDMNAKAILDKDGKPQIITTPYHFDSFALLKAMAQDKVALRNSADAVNGAVALLRVKYAAKHKDDVRPTGADGKPLPNWDPIAADPEFVAEINKLSKEPALAPSAPLIRMKFADFDPMRNDGILSEIASLGPLVDYGDEASR